MTGDNWISVTVGGAGLLFSVLTAAIAHGASRQKLNDVCTRQNKSDERMDKMESRVEGAERGAEKVADAVKHMGELFAAEMKHMGERFADQARIASGQFDSVKHEVKQVQQALLGLAGNRRSAPASRD